MIKQNKLARIWKETVAALLRSKFIFLIQIYLSERLKQRNHRRFHCFTTGFNRGHTGQPSHESTSWSTPPGNWLFPTFRRNLLPPSSGHVLTRQVAQFLEHATAPRSSETQATSPHPRDIISQTSYTVQCNVPQTAEGRPGARRVIYSAPRFPVPARIQQRLKVRVSTIEYSCTVRKNN